MVTRKNSAKKKVADKYKVPVVFSAPSKLFRFCAAIEKAKDNCVECEIKQCFKYVACTVGVLYKIPFYCGKAYIGQTGRV